MMIAISSAVYSLTGPVIIHNDEYCRTGEQQARVSRSATLDGGAVIVHAGVSAGDRTFFIDAALTETQVDDMKTLYAAGVNGVIVSVGDGVFFGSLSEIKPKNKTLQATILIKSKESD
jgi:hypothetical protein